MRIRLKLENRELTATLDDSETARDFASLLPLTLTLRDYVGKEKVSDLPRRISTTGAPAGIDPLVGDIAYYAPWGNLAVYYKDQPYADGLVSLGHMDAGIEALRVPGTVHVRIERLQETKGKQP